MNSPQQGIVKFLFMNAQSIVNKIDLLQTHVCELKPDIIGITESWTHEDITDGVLKIKGYDLIGRCNRTDTVKGRGGGILLYSKLSNLYVNSVNKSEQVIHATVSNKFSEDIQIHCFYRSPNSSMEMTEEVIKYIESTPSNSILVGDFNFPDIDWSTLSCTSAPGQLFLNSVNDKFLIQHVDFPTNFTPQPDGSVTATCIDLVLTNNDDLIASVKPMGQLGASHHSMIQVEMIIPTSSNSTEELVPDYSKANFSQMREMLAAIDWQSRLNDLNAEDSWTLFKNIVSSTVDACIPKKKRRNNSKPLWMQRNVMRIIRKKRRLWKQYTTSREYQTYLAYKRVQNEAKSMVTRAKRELEKKLAANAKKNPKMFYSYISNRSKVQSKVGPLKDLEGHVQTDDLTQAKILNDKFSTAFTREDMTSLPIPDQIFDPVLGPPLSTVNVTEKMVVDKISALKPGASGPDKIGPLTLRELSAQLSFPISMIFNKSLSETLVPNDWKLSNVTPIFKKRRQN